MQGVSYTYHTFLVLLLLSSESESSELDLERRFFPSLSFLCFRFFFFTFPSFTPSCCPVAANRRASIAS